MHEPNGSSNGDSPADTLRSEAKQREIALLLDSITQNENSGDQIRSAVRPFCAQARSENIDATELVKIVKQSFAGSGLAAALTLAGERQQALDRIISVCIDEYYAAGGNDAV